MVLAQSGIILSKDTEFILTTSFRIGSGDGRDILDFSGCLGGLPLFIFSHAHHQRSVLTAFVNTEFVWSIVYIEGEWRLQCEKMQLHLKKSEDRNSKIELFWVPHDIRLPKSKASIQLNVGYHK